MQTLIEQGLSGAFGVVSLPLLVVLFIILIRKALRVLAGIVGIVFILALIYVCLLYTSPSPRDGLLSRMPSSA